MFGVTNAQCIYEAVWLPPFARAKPSPVAGSYGSWFCPHENGVLVFTFSECESGPIDFWSRWACSTSSKSGKPSLQDFKTFLSDSLKSFSDRISIILDGFDECKEDGRTLPSSTAIWKR